MMNCSDAYPLLSALADNESSAQSSAALQQHVDQCANCRGVVAEWRRMRRAVARVIDDEPVPARLMASLNAQFAAPTPAARRPVFNRVAVLRPLAAAAVLLLTAGVSWSVWNWASGDEQTSVPWNLPTPLANLTVSTHCRCAISDADGARMHQSANLPDDIDQLRAESARLVSNQIELAALNLYGVGYQFESCNMCGVQRFGEGVHLMYRSVTSGAHLSLFSVPRCDLRSIVGWQSADQSTTYLACAAVPQDELLAIAGGMFDAIQKGARDVELGNAVGYFTKLYRQNRGD
jgi:hypothetical protein